MNEVIQSTIRKIETRYSGKPDDEIIQDIRKGYHAGESLFYLLFGRYAEMLHVIFGKQAKSSMDFDDFILELDIRLFKDDCRAIRRYQSEKSSFKTYLSTIARNLLYDLREKELPVLDVDALDTVLNNHYNGDEVISLVEEINTYPNKDSRYVLLKTIEGYKSKEIAIMLTSRRHEDGTLDKNEELKPSYIDTLRSRALKTIRKHIFGTNKLSVCKDITSVSVRYNMDVDEFSMPESPIMADQSMDAPMMNVETLFMSAGMFISNIMNLYDQMMEE